MKIIKAINSMKPMAFKALATTGLIGEPLIFSISKNNSRPPSSAGNGNKLITARLIDIKAVKDMR